MILANHHEIDANNLVIATIKRSYRRPACSRKESIRQAWEVIEIAMHSFGMLAMTNQELFT